MMEEPGFRAAWPSRARFEELVEEAIESIPDALWARIENVAVMVEEWPSRYQLDAAGLRYREQLLGLYEGVPLPAERAGHGL